MPGKFGKSGKLGSRSAADPCTYTPNDCNGAGEIGGEGSDCRGKNVTLDRSLQQLIAKIRDAEQNYLREKTDKAMVSRNWEFILDDYDGWVIIDLKTKQNGSYGGFWMESTLNPIGNVDALKSKLPEFNANLDSVAYASIQRLLRGCLSWWSWMSIPENSSAPG